MGEGGRALNMVMESLNSSSWLLMGLRSWSAADGLEDSKGGAD